MLSAVMPMAPSCPDNAIEKHTACAAPISSSGLVPGPFPNRVVNEYLRPFSAPLSVETSPFPSSSDPFQTALPLRFMKAPFNAHLLPNRGLRVTGNSGKLV